MTITTPEIITVIASLLGMYAYYPYIRDTLRRKTRPHVFTWLVWNVLMFIALLAQIAEGAGIAAVVTGMFVLLNGMVVFLSFRYGEKTITRSDWVMLFCSLMAIPLWLMTKDPAWSVILIALIDVIAFIPTFRKSWTKPAEETLQTYILCSGSLALSLLVLESRNISTVLYPATLVGANIIFVSMVLWRRHWLGRTAGIVVNQDKSNTL